MSKLDFQIIEKSDDGADVLTTALRSFNPDESQKFFGVYGIDIEKMADLLVASMGSRTVDEMASVARRIARDAAEEQIKLLTPPVPE